MSTPFLSSEEYDERAHQLYNEGRYDEAIEVLQEGLTIYPNAVELHVGIGYAQLAREEFAWARMRVRGRPALEPEHGGRPGRPWRSAAQFGSRKPHCAASVGPWSSATRTTSTSCSRSAARSSAKRRSASGASCSPSRRSSSRRRCSRRRRAPRRSPASGMPASARRGRRGHRVAAQVAPGRQRARRGAHLPGDILYDRGDYEASLYHFERTLTEDHCDAWDLAADRAEAGRVQARRARRGPETVGRPAAGAGWRARRHRRAVHRDRRRSRG